MALEALKQYAQEIMRPTVEGSRADHSPLEKPATDEQTGWLIVGHPPAPEPQEKTDTRKQQGSGQMRLIHSSGEKEQKKADAAPFTGIDSSRNYRAVYRAVCLFHEAHNPPRLALDYWESVAADINAITATFDNDPFLVGLLIAVYEELEREYKSLEAEQGAVK